MLQLRNRRQVVLDNYFNGCRSSAGLSSENLGNDVKIETTISASESGSSLKVSIFFFLLVFAFAVCLKSTSFWCMTLYSNYVIYQLFTQLTSCVSKLVKTT